MRSTAIRGRETFPFPQEVKRGGELPFGWGGKGQALWGPATSVGVHETEREKKPDGQTTLGGGGEGGGPYTRKRDTPTAWKPATGVPSGGQGALRRRLIRGGRIIFFSNRPGEGGEKR